MVYFEVDILCDIVLINDKFQENGINCVEQMFNIRKGYNCLLLID